MRGARKPEAGVPPPDGQPGPGGLFDSLRRLLATLLAIAQTRLSLLANEVQEETLRLRRLIVLAFAAVFLLALGVVLGTAYFILLLWESHGLAIIGVFALIYIGAGVAFGLYVYRKSLEGSRLFQASLAELGKDRERLSP
ncbi:MAG: phage holin family protein [Burkholderiales bacterium]